MGFLKEFYEPLITLVFGTFGIVLIVRGSILYGKIGVAKVADGLVKKASKMILIGNTMMALTALMAMNHRFLLPEIATVLTAVRPFLESRSILCHKFFAKIHAEIWFILAALLIGAYVLIYHVDYDNALWHILAPLGLTFLAIGFSIGGELKLQKIYRMLMVLGGLLLTVGSAYQIYFSEDHTVRIMGIAFFVLNFLFTVNEIKERLKMRSR